MNLIKSIQNFLLTALSSTSLMLAAHHVAIENSQGEAFILPVHPEDTFADVMDSIQAFRNDGLVPIEEEFFTLEVSIPAKNFFATEKFSKNAKKVFKNNDAGAGASPQSSPPQPLSRDYGAGISPQEAADVTFILKTMANSSLPKIKSAESALKKAGDRIAYIHPFFFLSTIFSNEELKVCIRNLHGRAWVWKEFLRGIVDSLTEEHAKGNVLPFVDDFAASIHVDPIMILPILQAARWERFVNTLIEIVPREGEANRYNM